MEKNKYSGLYYEWVDDFCYVIFFFWVGIAWLFFNWVAGGMN